MAVLLMGCTDGSIKPETASATTPYDSIMQAEGYDAVPLFKTRTGHITVTLQVNGKACVFLVDTGGGATLIDISKKDKYQLSPLAVRDYATGIGSATPLVRTKGIFCINGKKFRNDSLFLMDISYINAEFKKNHSRQVDGVLGTDFLEKYKAIVDYSRSILYLKYTTTALASSGDALTIIFTRRTILSIPYPCPSRGRSSKSLFRPLPACTTFMT